MLKPILRVKVLSNVKQFDFSIASIEKTVLLAHLFFPRVVKINLVVYI